MMMVKLDSHGAVKAITFTTFDLGGYGTQAIGADVSPSTKGLTPDEYYDRLQEMINKIDEISSEPFASVHPHHVENVNLHLDLAGDPEISAPARNFPTPLTGDFRDVVGKVIATMRAV